MEVTAIYPSTVPGMVAGGGEDDPLPSGDVVVVLTAARIAVILFLLRLASATQWQSNSSSSSQSSPSEDDDHDPAIDDVEGHSHPLPRSEVTTVRSVTMGMDTSLSLAPPLQ